MRYFLITCLLFLLTACPLPPEWVRTQRSDDGERLILGRYEDHVLAYQLEPTLPPGIAENYERGGFLHPLYSPAGRVVTDDFPAGYSHQHGLFTAWTKARFRGEEVDFWNQQRGLGTVRPTGEVRWRRGGFDAQNEHVSLKHGVVLREVLSVRMKKDEERNLFTLRSEQTNVTEDTLFLLQHIYGGLGLRGSKHWNPADSAYFQGPARFLTSEGKTRIDGNHTRPRWAAIYGEIDRKTSGVAVLPSPKNRGGLHFVRLHPEQPYLSLTPVVEEGFFIEPGETYVAEYRVLVFDGEPEVRVLDKLAGTY